MPHNVSDSYQLHDAHLAADEIGIRVHPRFKMQYGEDGVAVDVSLTNPLPINDPMLDISRGLLVGITHINKFGRNPDVDSGDHADIWDGGSRYIPPTDARIHGVVSNNDEDGVGGDGARTVLLIGLDVNWDLVEELITLTGQTPVNTNTTFRRIHRMKVMSAGSNQNNIGTILAVAAVDGTSSAVIRPDIGQTLMAIYTVPRNKTAYITSFYCATVPGIASPDNLVEMHFRIGIDTLEPALQTKHVLGLLPGGSSAVQHAFLPYKVALEKTDIILHTTTTINNTDITGGFDLILVDN